MSYLGNYTEDYATLNFKFTTRDSTGLPTTLAGSPVVKVYTGSATATESTAGVTLAVDFDGVTGLNNVLIDLSADAFYATGADYAVVITTGTVDSISVVGEVVATFSIENRFMRGTDSANTTAPDNANVVNIHNIVKAAGTGDLAAILLDTGTTLDALIKDVPTVAEFNARSILAAAYALDATVAKSATVALDATVAKAATALAAADLAPLALDATVAKDATVSKPGTAQTITAPADMALDSTVAKEATADAVKVVTDKLATVIEVIP